MKLLSISTLILITAISFNLDTSIADAAPPSGCSKVWRHDTGLDPMTGQSVSVCKEGGDKKCYQTHNEQKKFGCVTDEQEDALRMG